MQDPIPTQIFKPVNGQLWIEMLLNNNQFLKKCDINKKALQLAVEELIALMATKLIVDAKWGNINSLPRWGKKYFIVNQLVRHLRAEAVQSPRFDIS